MKRSTRVSTLVVCITEGIPVRDMIRTRYRMQGKKTLLLGPTVPA